MILERIKEKSTNDFYFLGKRNMNKQKRNRNRIVLLTIKKWTNYGEMKEEEQFGLWL